MSKKEVWIPIIPIPRDFYSFKCLKEFGCEDIRDAVSFRLEFGVWGLNCEWKVWRVKESVRLKFGMKVYLGLFCYDFFITISENRF